MLVCRNLCPKGDGHVPLTYSQCSLSQKKISRESKEELAHILLRHSQTSDHNHLFTPLKSISLQVAPIANQAFKWAKIPS